jgi:hypothetical protein
MEKVILAFKVAGGAYALALGVSMLIGVIVLCLRKVISNRQEEGENA